MVDLAPPRVERRGGLELAGLRRSYRLANDLATIMHAVARQWRSFHEREDRLGHTGGDYYGVLLHVGEGATKLDYFCGMAQSREAPDGFSALAIPPLRYAVFRHTGPTATLPTTYFTIFGKLLPEAGLVPAYGASGAPDFIERFDAAYDLKTGTGGPEILVPVKD